MDFIKKLFSAIFLSLILSMPLVFIEAFAIFTIIDLYKIPYFKEFYYYHIVGICFIIMITRNRIKIKNKNDKHDSDFKSDLINHTINRLFRVIFVLAVSLSFHQLFIR